MRNQEGKTELQKKVDREICLKNITFLAVCLTPPFQGVCLLSGPYTQQYIIILLVNNIQILKICQMRVMTSECIQFLIIQF